MIEVKQITHLFEGRSGQRPAHVLDSVSLTVADGEFITLLGPSGCGKTTLLRIIGGLVVPSQGYVTIDNVRVRGPARDRAMVFQEFNLLPWRNALRNAVFGLELLKIDKAGRMATARNALEKVGLDGFEAYLPHQLSGGMKQRVGIARALSIAPRHLLMDEPFGALDPMIRELMQIEMLRLLEREQRTVVLVTHSIDEAIFVSDRVVVFGTRPGRILDVIEIGLPKPRWWNDEQIKSSPEFVDYRQRIWRMLKNELEPSRAAAAHH